MKVGLLFAGQGSQYVGMASDLISNYKVVDDTFNKASQLLGYDVKEICLNDSLNQLNNTLYTQPVLVTFNHALQLLLDENNIKYDCVAGLSLGEYNALLSSNVLSFEDTLSIVKQRAKIMSEALPLNSTKMAAVLKGDINTINEVLSNSELNNEVAICNYNTFDQIVIGGTSSLVDKATDLLKEAGIKRVIELDVSLVSHMHLLNEASNKLADVLKNYSYSKPTKQFINNINASYQEDGFIDTLSLQISKPTHMAQTIELMLNDGITTFIEVGPKSSIASFIKSIAKKKNVSVKIMSITNQETFENVLKEVA